MMLQRAAANNSFSWWRGTHVRTKQSKWLDQSLQDMEQKVHNVLKLIEEDGDSFAKRAEMYYKKRPELVSFVEESYRAYRALAERYEHASTDLHTANNTLATLFPEQFQFAVDEDDDGVSKGPKGSSNRDRKGLFSASKQLQAKISAKTELSNNASVLKSGLSKSEAIEEIDKLQKDILALQTVKEFVKSSYQSGLSRYWGIENQIMEMQQRVCSLQDEFSLNKVIEANEARTLMAEAALKSCQETLAQLQEKQEKHDEEAKIENKKIEDAQKKLSSIRQELLNDQTYEEVKANEKRSDGNENQSSDSGAIDEKNKGKTEAGSGASITVTQLADKIDDLVNKVIGLESAVSSQTLLIERLRTEADDLHAQIRVLEEDKANLINDTDNLRSMMKKMEEKLTLLQNLNRDVESESRNFQANFAEACSSLDHLSENLTNVKPDEDEESPLKDLLASEEEIKRNGKAKYQTYTSKTEVVKDIKEQDSRTPIKDEGVKFYEPITKEILEGRSLIQKDDHVLEAKAQPVTEADKEGEFNWQLMLLNGLEDKDNILLEEYMAILRKYKEQKQKLSEMEKKNRDNQFEVAVHIRELKSVILKRDKEIQRLNQRLDALQESIGETKIDLDDRSIKPESNTVGIYLPSIDKEDEEDVKFILVDHPKAISPVEEKFQLEIDAILDESWNFWLRFSTSYHQIHKFKATVQDLLDEIAKLREKRRQKGSEDLKSDVWPVHNHLTEMQKELMGWLERSLLLKHEVEKRYSSLSNIQEKIMNALKEGVDENEELRFSTHQAAKFQGEILNMKQENKKMKEELQTEAENVTTLQVEIDEAIRMLNAEFGLSEDKYSQLRHSGSRPRIPLRAFLFGTKQKKHKHSIFSFMHSSKKFQVKRTQA